MKFFEGVDTKIFALGGLGEVGKNMYCVMHGDDIVIIDAGVSFPESELMGVDYVLPDFTFLKENEEFTTTFIDIGDKIGVSKKTLKWEFLVRKCLWKDY